MTKAYRLNATGGPEVLSFEEVSVGDPGPGEVRLRQTAVGLNFIDVYHRTGLYPLELPSGIGLEAAGVVEALGEGVTGFAIGDRVAYAGPPIGAYAEARLIPAKAIVKLAGQYRGCAGSRHDAAGHDRGISDLSYLCRSTG